MSGGRGNQLRRADKCRQGLTDYLLYVIGNQDHHGAGIVIGPTLNYMENAYLDARRGAWSEHPVIELLIPSTVDDTLAPEGKHVASLFCQHFPPQARLGAVQRRSRRYRVCRRGPLRSQLQPLGDRPARY